MKKLLLFGLGVSFCFAVPAHAQKTFSFTMPWSTTLSPPLALEPVADKPGAFTLKAGNYNFKELLETLAAKTGGKAIFVDESKFTSFDLRISFQGTVPELIAKLANFGFAVGKIGTDWVFVPTKKNLTFGSVILMPRVSRLVRPETAKPFDFGFNINPVPGQNLPPDARSFEFNNKRWYHVPLAPIRK